MLLTGNKSFRKILGLCVLKFLQHLLKKHFGFEAKTNFWYEFQSNFRTWNVLGTEFVVSFASRSLALKSLLKSHHMTTCFVLNDKFFTEMMMISLKLLF